VGFTLFFLALRLIFKIVISKRFGLGLFGVFFIFVELFAGKRRRDRDDSPTELCNSVLHVVSEVTDSWAVFQYLVTKNGFVVRKPWMFASEVVVTGRCQIKGRTILSSVKQTGWWVSGLLPCFIMQMPMSVNSVLNWLYQSGFVAFV